MIDFIHIGLAYAGMIVHVLIKYEKVRFRKDFMLNKFISTMSVTTVINIIMIPILLILMQDVAIQSILPINNITAVLAGYQTQSIFKSIMDRTSNKVKSDEQ